MSMLQHVIVKMTQDTKGNKMYQDVKQSQTQLCHIGISCPGKW